MLRKILNGVSYRIRHLSLKLWRLEGTEKHSGQKITVAYAGIERHKNYFARMAFEGAVEEADLGSYPAWALRSRLARHDCDGAFRVAEINHVRERFFPGAALKIPIWVRASCDLSAGAESMRSASRYRTHRQRLRQHEAAYRVLKDEAALRDFYENLYLPYTAHRHSGSTFTYSFEEVRKQFLSGQISALEKEGQIIAAQVLSCRGDTAHTLCMGVRREHEESLRKGILEVLNYCTLLQLAEAGVRTLDLGFSRGFLEDGVLRNKLRLGARLTGSIHRESGCLLYEAPVMTPGLQSFLEHNPVLLAEGESGVSIGIFKARGWTKTDSDKRLETECREDGFKGLKVITHEDGKFKIS